MKLRSMIFAAGLAGLPIVAVAPIAHAEPPIYTGVFSDTALQGYDPVAYFTSGAPVKGDDAFTADYMGAKFKFASAVNRDAFIEAPEKYAPQYGGYCAWRWRTASMQRAMRDTGRSSMESSISITTTASRRSGIRTFQHSSIARIQPGPALMTRASGPIG